MVSGKSMIQWFDYPLRVHPHHTDYAGVVWHGTYLSWLEEARVEYLRSTGIAFADLVTMDCDLPVVAMQLRYHRAVRMGALVRVRSRLDRVEKIRMYWQQQVDDPETGDLYFNANVELVPVNRAIGRVLRKFPPLLAEAIKKMQNSNSSFDVPNLQN
jgi:acyl-CoA thioester hydrolase